MGMPGEHWLSTKMFNADRKPLALFGVPLEGFAANAPVTVIAAVNTASSIAAFPILMERSDARTFRMA